LTKLGTIKRYPNIRHSLWVIRWIFRSYEGIANKRRSKAPFKSAESCTF